MFSNLLELRQSNRVSAYISSEEEFWRCKKAHPVMYLSYRKQDGSLFQTFICAHSVSNFVDNDFVSCGVVFQPEHLEIFFADVLYSFKRVLDFSERIHQLLVVVQPLS